MEIIVEQNSIVAKRLLACARESFAQGEYEAAGAVIDVLLGDHEISLAPLLLALDETRLRGSVLRQMAQCGERRAQLALLRHLDQDVSSSDLVDVGIGELTYSVPIPLAAAYHLALVGSRAGADVLKEHAMTGRHGERIVSSHGLAALAVDSLRSILERIATTDALVEPRIFAAVGLARLGDTSQIVSAIGHGVSDKLEQLYHGDPLVVSAQIHAIGPMSDDSLGWIESVLDETTLDDWWAYVLGAAVHDLRRRNRS